jgi:hypothetical protein
MPATFSEHGVPAAVTLTIMEMLGAGLATYGRRPPTVKPGPAPKELRQAIAEARRFISDRPPKGPERDAFEEANREAIAQARATIKADTYLRRMADAGASDDEIRKQGQEILESLQEAGAIPE